MLVARVDTPRRAPAPQPAAQDADTGSPAQAQEEEVTEIEAVQVTGSRIPRAQIEGPAPISVITAEEIRANGFTSVPDVLRGMTQNSGETQSQQSASGADFSPGAEQVDLRGLGPNHTLVLVNGRRIADFPMPFKGRSNFTDISSIPIGMIERVEVLTGSASAIYGSDAVSGVVNFILKKHVDGAIVDVRMGTTTEGGGESFNASLVDGFERGRFSGLYGFELQSQTPLWAYDREIQDSTKDAPTANSQIARRAYLRTDWWDDYIDPGQDTCDALAGQNGSTTYYANRPRYGYYCGSDESIGYGTILSKRRGVNAYASLSYAFGNGSEWFADIQAGYHDVEIFRDVSSWSYMAPDGNEEGYFYNDATGQVEYWQRQFSPEEMGGLDRGMVETTQKTLGLTTGFKGTFAGDWDYEASLSWSQYKAEISWPQIVAAAANALFFGPQLGVDDDGFPIFNADPSRLYTPLTRAEYDSIAARSVYHPQSQTGTLALTVAKADLFTLPGGDAGFAGTVELGNQSYDLNPDPLATQYYYYSWKDSDGHGSRNRWATAGELRMPLLDSLNWSLTGRYDQYRYSGNSIGKATRHRPGVAAGGQPAGARLVRHRVPRARPALRVFGHRQRRDLGQRLLLLPARRRRRLFRLRGRPDPHPRRQPRTGAGNQHLVDRRPYLVATGRPGPVGGLVRHRHARPGAGHERGRDPARRGGLQARRAGHRLADLRRRAGPRDPLVQRLAVRHLRQSDQRGPRIHQRRGCGRALPLRHRDRPLDADLQPHLGQRAPVPAVPRRPGRGRVRGQQRLRHPADQDQCQHRLGQRHLVGDPVRPAPGKLPNGWSYDQVWEGGRPGSVHRRHLPLQRHRAVPVRRGLAADPMVTNLANKMPPKDPTYTAYPYYDISWFDSVGRTISLQFTHQFGGGAQ